jgi:hypothetical protein
MVWGITVLPALSEPLRPCRIKKKPRIAKTTTAPKAASMIGRLGGRCSVTGG